MRILVAESDPKLRASTCDAPEQAGHRVTPRRCGARTLRTLQERPFDLLLLDSEIAMFPAAELVEFLAELNRDTRVIVCCQDYECAKFETLRCDVLVRPVHVDDVLALPGLRPQP